MTLREQGSGRPSTSGRRKWCRWMAAGMVAGTALIAQALETERLQNGKSLPPDMPRLYVSDFAIGHLSDGRVHVLDGRNGKWAGLVDAGYSGQFTMSPDGKELYVATAYLARHTHGERTDVVEIYDADTLRMKGDVVLPMKRAQAAFLKNLLRTSGDGRYLFVQNATPATSISIVDLTQKKVISEVPTPGCWGIYPSQTEARRFSILCGDGKLTTLTLDESGKAVQRTVSAKFFDADKDPVFVQAEQNDGRYYFVSFTGTLHRIDARGEQAVVEQSLSFVPTADRKQGWRPGGSQLLAFDRQRQQLLVGMHPKGAEGTHKTQAQEIWTIDIAGGKRVARTKASKAIALAVGQSEPHYLYALNGETNQVVAYDLKTRRQVFVTEPVGTTSLQIDAP